MTIECGHQVIFNFGGRDSCMLCKADLTPAGSEEPTRPAEDHDKVLDALHNKLVEEVGKE